MFSVQIFFNTNLQVFFFPGKRFLYWFAGVFFFFCRIPAKGKPENFSFRLAVFLFSCLECAAAGHGREREATRTVEGGGKAIFFVRLLSPSLSLG